MIVPAPLRLLDEFRHWHLFQHLVIVAPAERWLVRNLGQAPPPHQLCRDRRSLPAELSPRHAAGRAPRLRLGVARGGWGHTAEGTPCLPRKKASYPLARSGHRFQNPGQPCLRCSIHKIRLMVFTFQVLPLPANFASPSQETKPMTATLVASPSKSSSSKSASAMSEIEFGESTELRGSLEWAPPRAQLILKVHAKKR